MLLKNLEESKECPITKKEILSFKITKNIYYEVKVKDEILSFCFCKKSFEEIDFKKHRTTIFGLILNGKLNVNKPNLVLHWDDAKEDSFNLKQFLEESYYPKTPKEKYDNLISQLYNEQIFIGWRIEINGLLNKMFLEKCYLGRNEFERYMEALEEEKLIKRNLSSSGRPINITFKGFNYLEELEKNGSESKNCFIAMAFKNETISARKAIKKAIIKTGFTPIIIDEENIDSDQTINDAIIAGIKKSKFCIADFSYHRNGVYFESGYALGLGKPVIYCCSKEEFKNAHFDIKPLQHIIYDAPEQLEKNLIHKIEAWIK